MPPDLPAAVLVVWHTSSESPNLLPDILQRVASLPISSAVDGEALQSGRAYIAPPDYHLVLETSSTRSAPDSKESGGVRLSRGPKENRFRPSIDVLFRSAALAFKSRVIGVVLTGALDDGSSGLYAIKKYGGLAVVQDPLDAECLNMTINAMRAVEVEHSMPIAQLGDLLSRLVSEPQQEGDSAMSGQTVSETLQTEVRIALEDGGLENGVMQLGELSVYTCPECHGVLMQIHEGKIIRFRCHTGHAYSLDSLLTEISASVEDALWNALRAIEEEEMILNHMATHFRDHNNAEAAELFARKVEKAHRRARQVRQATMSHKITKPDEGQAAGANKA